jgi:hypothetical protein
MIFYRCYGKWSSYLSFTFVLRYVKPHKALIYWESRNLQLCQKENSFSF